jgi:tetratricopeptide (TPR) repeat protein
VLLFRHAREESCPIRRGELLDQALDRYPNHTEALLARADLAIEREDLSTAFLDLEAAHRRDPDNPALCYRFARHDYLLGKWDDALGHIDRTITFSMPLEEIHWQGRMLRARIWKAMLRCEEALQEWATLETRLEKDANLLPGLLLEVRRQQADCRAMLDMPGEAATGGSSSAAKGKVPA